MLRTARDTMVLAVSAGLSGLISLPAEAQERRASHCIAIADAAPGLQYLHKAAWTDPVPEYSVRIQYLSHAAFLIQTRGGLNAVTDFTGYIGNVPMIPDIVTMNHAHSSHWTANPDPAIPHILEGWGEFGEGIEHHLDLGEMLVRNVSTDIRSAYGGTEEKGNSIFVFEVEGLCIGHLGHLHHEPSDEQYAALGRVDVLMVPVDGGMTMALDSMVRVVERLRSSVILPMHWFSGASLERFIADVSDTFPVDRRDTSELVIGLRDLPPQPTVMVLQPEWLSE
ncbi:MBL fold metallo-hydrolase [Alloyangia pacifica]|uniref:L-ascorbate metabolism protein UlaG, beta-lactamase superfamily n=1 Tax=Alloyangia pacifica TaxID=311180 RepID=A0A1I6TKY7_9RHOB|nr:MBL fold metallo-hydrolase [Alloyangia pacifica]SDH14941.1 L-ascorbate metabolism protein UlaG, beta-lactamase superfamily [Alloyangia pacifica]SFS89800.1 L-ascorbate metabolism protein UlaG, beta-lactamase superfamily [Alloyangia pacifica]